MPLCSAEQVEAALHAGQHAKRQAIDLHELQRVDIVLVPFDDLAVFHGGGLDRHQLVEPVMGQDEAARDAGERWRGAPISSRARSSASRRRRSPRLRFSSSACFVLDAFLRPAPDLGGQHLDQVLGQAERLADIAQRALGAIADDGRAEGGVVAAIGVEDPLHDDLAPLVLEIDVDVRRLAPLLRDEALEQQVVALGIDRGDAEHVADGASWRPSRGPGRECPGCGRSGRSQFTVRK